MNPLRLILVAHDFGTHSDAALESAIVWAKQAGAKIHVLHSFSPPIGGTSPLDDVFPAAAYEAVRDTSKKRLEEIRASVAARGVEATIELTTAFPTDAILDAARRTKADLVALGTHGRTGFKHALLGSVAERVMRLAPCPVLGVKEGAPAALPHRILVATDFSEFGTHARKVGTALAKQFGASLQLVHAFGIPLAVTTPYDMAIPVELIREARETARKKLESELALVRAEGVSAEAKLTEDPAAEQIAAVAKDTQCELIVIGTHGHTGLRHLLLGSVAAHTLRIASCPVLAVKSDPNPA